MLFVLILSFLSTAYADIPISDLRTLKIDGFQQVISTKIQTNIDVLPVEHSLSWPVEFENRENTMGNSMIQYQPYGAPYFHGGCDLRVVAQAEVHTPVSGKLEAGHYSYTKNDDGSLNKLWKPWPKTGESLYFEVSVIDANGIRYEFHHVDRSTLPKEIVDKLNTGETNVEKGDLIGRAVRWPSLGYNHIHYNIILPNGTRVNPEYVSTLIEDHTGPRAKLFAKRMNIYEEVQNEDSIATTNEFAVYTSDIKDDNTYEQPPVTVSLKLNEKLEFQWDFKKFLLHENKFPNLWSYLISNIRISNNRSLFTSGGYGIGKSIIRIPLPTNAQGKFQVELKDNAENITTLSGNLHL